MPATAPVLFPHSKVLLLGLISLMMPLWNDMLFPILPALQQDFGVSPAAVQPLISLFLLTNAFMCLWHGVIADAFGRRITVLVALGTLTLTSLACLWVTRLEVLWFLRALQGLAAGVGVILYRAIIRDIYQGEAIQQMIARVSLFQSVGPILLPLLAGWLTVWWGWQAVFAFLGGVGALLWLVCLRHLSESLPPERRSPLSVRHVLHNYRTVLSSALFVSLSLAHGVNWLAMFLYIAAAPQFVVVLLGQSVTDIYVIFVLVMVGMGLGLVMLPWFLRRSGPSGALRWSYVCFTVAVCTNLGMAWALEPGWAHLLPLVLLSYAIGLSVPLMMGWSLQPFQRNAGLAASSQMCIQFAFMALGSGIIAPLLWHSLLALALGQAGLLLIGGGLMFWHARASRSMVASAE